MKKRSLLGACRIASLLPGASGLVRPGPGAPASSLPAPSLPVPTGPHRLGTVVLHFTGASRPDPVFRDAGRFREIMVQVWYPATVREGAKTAPYFTDPAVIEAS